MAGNGAWSRWDAYPGVSDAVTASPGFNRQYDTSGGLGAANEAQTQFIRTTLVDQKINTIDPSFYDCVYGVANSAQTVIERCYKDIGCCQGGCCSNKKWQVEYGWAVALIVLFCVLVIFAVVIWLIVWLFNRSKDKKLKRQLLGNGTGLSPAQSQMSLAHPIQGGYHFGTGPFQSPPGSGYRY